MTADRIERVLRRLIARLPVPVALLRMNLLFRTARSMQRLDGYDAILSTINETAVGVRAIQYVHYPWSSFPRPACDYRWYHWSPPLRLYRWLCARISGYSCRRAALNLTLDQRTLIDQIEHFGRAVNGDKDRFAVLIQNRFAVLVYLGLGDLVAAAGHIARDGADGGSEHAVLYLAERADAGHHARSIGR